MANLKLFWTFILLGFVPKLEIEVTQNLLDGLMQGANYCDDGFIAGKHDSEKLRISLHNPLLNLCREKGLRYKNVADKKNGCVFFYKIRISESFADLIGGGYPTCPWGLCRPFRNMSVDHLLNSDPGHNAGRTFRLRA
jgi:hypothetical protein